MKVQHLNAGEIIAAPIGNSNPIAIPHGLIHHWIGPFLFRVRQSRISVRF